MQSNLRKLSSESVPATVAVLVLTWVYWPTLASLVGRWGTDPQYSHGYLVPLFALFLLWFRRTLMPAGPGSPSWWGLPLLLLALLARFAGIYLYLDWLAAVSLVPCVAAVFLLVGGLPALRWAWPAVLFLIFMVPLPFQAEVALAHPLQRVATRASTYTLQTLGFTAFAEGNVIRLGQVRIGVVEACSGLSMLVIFFALSAAVILLVRRPWYEKAVIFFSAIPIAVVVNVLRITVTGILHKTVSSRLADLVFHDLAGWLMMPVALGLMWCELRLLAWVIIPATKKGREPSVAVVWAGPPLPGQKAPAPANAGTAAANPAPAPKAETNAG
jgi:exosortase